MVTSAQSVVQNELRRGATRSIDLIRFLRSASVTAHPATQKKQQNFHHTSTLTCDAHKKMYQAHSYTKVKRACVPGNEANVHGTTYISHRLLELKLNVLTILTFI